MYIIEILLNYTLEICAVILSHLHTKAVFKSEKKIQVGKTERKYSEYVGSGKGIVTRISGI